MLRLLFIIVAMVLMFIIMIQMILSYCSSARFIFEYFLHLLQLVVENVESAASIFEHKLASFVDYVAIAEHSDFQYLFEFGQKPADLGQASFLHIGQIAEVVLKDELDGGLQEFEDVALVYFLLAFDWEVLLQAIHTDFKDIDNSLCFCGGDLSSGGDFRLVKLWNFLFDHHEGRHCDCFGYLALAFLELVVCFVYLFVDNHERGEDLLQK